MINFTAWPEMIAWPYLMLNNFLPYKDIAIAHNPLMLVVLTLFYKAFGVGVNQLIVFTLLVISLNLFLTNFVANRFWGKKVALLTLPVYLSLMFIYEGSGLWFDLTLVPFGLLLYLFLKKKKYFLSGVVFALGFLTKQTFIWFIIPLLFLIIKDKISFRKILDIKLGGLIVIFIFLLILKKYGILPDYLHWAIEFGILYLPKAEGQILLPNLKSLVFSISPIVISIFNPELFIFSFFGSMGVYPRFELFHFQPALPFVAIGLSSLVLTTKKKQIKVALALFLIVFASVGLKRQFGGNIRFYEDEVREVSDRLLNLGAKTSYVINYWDSVYAFSNTIPTVKPLIPYIPWYLNYNQSKENIIWDLKTNLPDALVVKDKDKLNWTELEQIITRYYSCLDVKPYLSVCSLNK